MQTSSIYQLRAICAQLEVGKRVSPPETGGRLGNIRFFAAVCSAASCCCCCKTQFKETGDQHGQGGWETHTHHRITRQDGVPYDVLLPSVCNSVFQTHHNGRCKHYFKPFYTCARGPRVPASVIGWSPNLDRARIRKKNREEFCF